MFIYLNGDFETFEFKDVDIYGMGFTDYYLNNANISNLKVKNKDKLNILVMHADLNASKDVNTFLYNPVTENELKNLGFDYIALGHIHASNFSETGRIIYPGSLISLGFDELGNHGLVDGIIEKNYIKLNFVNIDERNFEEIEFDISDIYDEEELIEKINDMKINEKNMYKLIITGKRNFLIDLKNLNKSIIIHNILKVVDNTVARYNLDELSKEISLKGFFVKECLKKLETGEYTRAEIEKAIEIGIDAMEKG